MTEGVAVEQVDTEAVAEAHDVGVTVLPVDELEEGDSETEVVVVEVADAVVVGE